MNKISSDAALYSFISQKLSSTKLHITKNIIRIFQYIQLFNEIYLNNYSQQFQKNYFFCFSSKCMNHEHIIIKIQKNSSLVLGTKSFYRNNERFKVQWCYLLYKENTFLSSIHFEENESLAGEKYISTMILYTILDDRRISWKLNDPKQITFSIHFV